MPYLARNGLRLAYEEAGQGEPAFLFLHGWMCDRSHFAPQMARFSRMGRCVAVDLRGHGESDKPEQDYSIAVLADDLRWLCAELGLRKPVVAGHSMGGVVAYRLAAIDAALPGAIVALDCPIAMAARHHDALERAAQRFHGPDYEKEVRRFVGNMFLPIDDAGRREHIIDMMLAGPSYVGISAFDAFLADPISLVDSAPRIEVPLLAIASAGGHMADLGRLRELTPLLVTGQAVGAGHFLHLEVPDQVNSMIERFLRLIEGWKPAAA
jgi:pimeloyl-ACP methyl ester carboxylesterase